MSPNLSLFFDGKKFMWDGQIYTSREEVSPLEAAYIKDGFEVRVVEEADTFLLYTRRVVKEVVVTTQ